MYSIALEKLVVGGVNCFTYKQSEGCTIIGVQLDFRDFLPSVVARNNNYGGFLDIENTWKSDVEICLQELSKVTGLVSG